MSHLIFSWENFVLSNIFMEFFMEKKEKVMDDYLFHAVESMVLICTTYCITKIISTHCDMS